MTHRHRVQRHRLALIPLRAARLADLLDRAHEAAALTLPDGYPAGGTEPVSGGDVSRPVEGVVLERERILECREGDDEAIRVGFAAVDVSLTVIDRALTEIHEELSKIAARTLDGVERARTNMVDCAACERPIAGTPNDRAKAGYCPACYTAWNRAGRPDRPTFERSRRGIDTTPHVNVRDTGTVEQVELTVEGVTVTLPADLAAELAGIERPGPEDIRRLHAAAIERQA